MTPCCWGLAVAEGGSLFVCGRDAAIGDYGADALVLRSPDGGQSWERLELGKRVEGLKAIACDGRRVLAVGVAGSLLQSSDLGKTWQASRVGLAKDQLSDVFALGRLVYVAAQYHRLWRSTDGGASFEADFDTPDISDDFEQLAASATGHLFSVGNQVKRRAEPLLKKPAPALRRRPAPAPAPAARKLDKWEVHLTHRLEAWRETRAEELAELIDQVSAR